MHQIVFLPLLLLTIGLGAKCTVKLHVLHLTHNITHTNSHLLHNTPHTTCHTQHATHNTPHTLLPESEECCCL